MKTFGMLCALLAGALLAGQAQAQAPGQGYYMGLGYGSVWSNGGSFFPNTINEDTVSGGRIVAGYMQDDRWGMEIGLHHLGEYEVFLLGTKTDEFKTTAVSVAGVMSVPVATGYFFNVRLGLAFTEAKYDCIVGCGVAPFVDTKKRGTSGMIGLGVGARLTQALSMRIDFDHFGDVRHAVGNNEYKESYDVLTVNLLVQF